METTLIVVLSLALFGLLEAGWHGFRFLSERHGNELRRRLQASGATVPLDSLLLRQGRFSSIPALDRWLSEIPLARRAEHLLEQADSRITVAQLVVLSLAAGGAGVLAIPWLGVPAGLALAAMGVCVPGVVLLVARDRRSRKLSEQLPEALDMMSRSLRAGHALASAFELVATEMPEPISVEFARAFEEQRLGMPLERAVREMAARAPRNGDLKLFAVSTVIQKETGGNLALILDGIAATVRERYRFFGKLRALTAEARASAWFVSLMPLAIAAFLVASQPAYMRVLVDNEMGRVILAGGLGAWGIGVAWFHRLTQFDF